MKIFILTMAVAGGVLAQDPLGDALRKGIVAEEVDSDLNAAIKAYQSVLARFDTERQTAATALFRMAECYRKLGRNDSATAAYTRLVQQFPEQTALVERSRKYVAVAAKPAQTPSAAQPTPQMQAARKVCREALAELVAVARAHANYVSQQQQLGAVSSLEVDAPKVRLAQAEADLAAFDAGVDLAPLVPAGPGLSGEAGRRYRQLLEQQLDAAVRAQKASKNRYELGMIDQREFVAEAAKIPEARCRLAAFDAGWVQRPSLAGH